MGAKIWSDNTCIDFVEDRSAKDKVIVDKLDGCVSAIGRMGGDQLLALDGSATVGSAVHEIGHTLGFFHTMARYDRDNYVIIVEENIDPNEINQFRKVSSDLSDFFGLTYDYGSVMHYGELSGSINKRPTVIATNPYYQKTMGSDTISFSDIFMVNQHYGCTAKCNNPTSAKCKNGGFPHPRNCSICICPGGYGGGLCDQRPPGCGGDIMATANGQTIVCSLGVGSGTRDLFDFCNIMITAPVGKRIELEILSIARGYEWDTCLLGGIEIKAQMDQRLTGYRFCSTSGTEGPFVISSNPLPVILFNRYGTMEVNFTLRYVD